MTIDETTALLREFGNRAVSTDLTVSEMTLIASALRLATSHPGVADSDVVLSRISRIVDKLRGTATAVDENLYELFTGQGIDIPSKWPKLAKVPRDNE